MARAISKIMAVPRRLPLGCQRQSLYLPRSRAKKGRWADAGVSNEPTTVSQAECDCLDISPLAKLQSAAIFGQIGAAARPEAVALGIRRTSSSSKLGAPSDRNRPHISQLCEMGLHGFRLNVTVVHAA